MDSCSILGSLLQFMTLHWFLVALRVTWILSHTAGTQCLSIVRQMSLRVAVTGLPLVLVVVSWGWRSANRDSPLGRGKPVHSHPQRWEQRRHSLSSRKEGKWMVESPTTDIHYSCFQSTRFIFFIQKTLSNPKTYLFLACYVTHF